MVNKTTNVSADELNYDKYANDIYDDDIRRSIPGHNELHDTMKEFVIGYLKKYKVKKILELGVGTGITSEKVLNIIPTASLKAVDFSSQMMIGAKRRLSKYNVEYVLGDYSELDFGIDFDMVISVIGIHHQTDVGKNNLFKKVFNCLMPGGIFIFGDLVTYKSKKKAAVNESLHYHYLVENARDSKALEEWSYHHKFLNLLAPIEDQIEWLKKAGFSSVEIKYEHLNTILVVAIK